MRTSIKILLLTVTSFLFVENVLRAQSWTPASPNIYFTGGNVGIGTTVPSKLLTLTKPVSNAMGASIYLSNNQYASNVGAGTEIIFGHFSDTQNPRRYSRIYSIGTQAYGTADRLSFGSSDDTYTDAMSITFPNNNVGIGTTNPVTKLDVNGSINLASGYNLTWGGTYGANIPTIASVSGGSSYIALYPAGSTSGEKVRINNTGNVGIGTTSPLAKLHLNNGSVLFDGTTGATPTSGAGTRMMWIPAKGAFRAGATTGAEWDNGNIGTTSVAFGNGSMAGGVASSAFGASIATGDYSASFGWGFAQSYGSVVLGRYNLSDGTPSSWVNTDPLFVIGNGTGTSARANALTVLKNGKTLIGNPNLAGFMGTPDGYLLFVQQGILAEKVKVAVATTAYWSDYVFDEKYKLKSIEDLESFVKTNKHLPNIPSAEEVVKNGIDMATMDAKLLEKIEELSLYIIQQNKRIEALEKKALYKK